MSEKILECCKVLSDAVLKSVPNTGGHLIPGFIFLHASKPRWYEFHSRKWRLNWMKHRNDIPMRFLKVLMGTPYTIRDRAKWTVDQTPVK